MTQTTLAPAPPIVTRDDSRDVEVVLVFAPADPIGRIEVHIDGDGALSTARIAQLLDATLLRLSVYIQGFREEMAADTE